MWWVAASRTDTGSTTRRGRSGGAGTAATVPWTAGYAVAIGGGNNDVVLNGDRVQPARAGDLLRHELTHVASLPAEGFPNGTAWWLVEGMAELAGAGGRPVSRYGSLPEVRRLLTAGKWDGQLATVEPPADAEGWEVTGRYGVGYLAVRHLADRFGERRLLEFFAAVVHERRPPDRAAWDVFGEEWAVLHEECMRVRAGGRRRVHLTDHDQVAELVAQITLAPLPYR